MKLAQVETYVAELRRLARPELMASDLRERRFIEHTLQIAIQAALDVASHIVSDERLGEPRTNQALFDLLAAGGWVTEETALAMRRAVGFRNVVVQGYASVDVEVVRDVVEHHLGDLLVFAKAIRSRLPPT
ncbi:MAG: DUF86 domain-containing protein [Myxococcales bacterium]|nr:DUF86 domain-containing protein [Myxococcales bacterium]